MEKHLQGAGMYLTEEEHISRITYQFEFAEIIAWKAEEIGMLKVQDKPEHLEIIQIQILESFRGKGLGTQVLISVLEKAAGRNLPVRLSVLKGNQAKMLYERLGFRVLDETEDSYVMEARGDNLKTV